MGKLKIARIIEQQALLHSQNYIIPEKDNLFRQVEYFMT